MDWEFAGVIKCADFDVIHGGRYSDVSWVCVRVKVRDPWHQIIPAFVLMLINGVHIL